MVYRDDVDRVLGDNDQIRTAFEKARADARLTSIRQVLLAFAFGLSWTVLGDDATPSSPPRLAWVDVRPLGDNEFSVNDVTSGKGPARITLRPGAHLVRFHGRSGDHCSLIHAREGETTVAIENAWGCP